MCKSTSLGSLSHPESLITESKGLLKILRGMFFWLISLAPLISAMRKKREGEKGDEGLKARAERYN